MSRMMRPNGGQGVVHETIHLDGGDAAHLLAYHNRFSPFRMVSSPFGHDSSCGLQRQIGDSRSSDERSRLALAALPARPLARLRLATAINILVQAKSRPLLFASSIIPPPRHHMERDDCDVASRSACKERAKSPERNHFYGTKSLSHFS